MQDWKRGVFYSEEKEARAIFIIRLLELQQNIVAFRATQSRMLELGLEPKYHVPDELDQSVNEILVDLDVQFIH